MEFSGEDDQTNSAGARPTGMDLQQQQEWWNQMPCLMIRSKSQIGGIKHMCRVITLERRSGVGEAPHLLIRQKSQVNLFCS